MGLIIYLFLFLWAVASLQGDPLVIPAITFPETVLAPLPTWLIYILLAASVPGAAGTVLLRVPFIRRRWRKFKGEFRKETKETKPDYEGVNYR